MAYATTAVLFISSAPAVQPAWYRSDLALDLPRPSAAAVVSVAATPTPFTIPTPYTAPATTPTSEPDPCLLEAPITLDFSRFSDEYNARVSVREVSNLTGADGAEHVSWFHGLITVTDGNDNTLIEQQTIFGPQAENCETGRLATNVYNWPYGTTSGLIYDDFDFDGIDDLALISPERSCYGLPAYTIYRGSNRGTLDKEPILTRSCELQLRDVLVFEQAETIGVMTKSGAGWHLWRTYEIVDHSPTPLHEVETQHWRRR